MQMMFSLLGSLYLRFCTLFPRTDCSRSSRSFTRSSRLLCAVFAHTLFYVAAAQSQIMEVQQQYISACTAIVKNTNLLLQNLTLPSEEIKRWEEVSLQIMNTVCIRVEDTLAASQLWVIVHRMRNTPTEELIVSEKKILKEVRACGILRMMMHREIVLNSPIELLDKSGFVKSLVLEISTMSPSCSEEVICMMQTCTLMYSCYSKQGLAFPKPLIQPVLGLILHHLDSATRKVSRVSEESLVNVIKNTPVCSLITIIGRKTCTIPPSSPICRLPSQIRIHLVVPFPSSLFFSSASLLATCLRCILLSSLFF